MRLHQMQFCLGVPMTVLIGKLLFLVKPYVVRLVCLFKLYHLKQLVQSFRKELPKCFTGFHAFHAANLANMIPLQKVAFKLDISASSRGNPESAG